MEGYSDGTVRSQHVDERGQRQIASHPLPIMEDDASNQPSDSEHEAQDQTNDSPTSAAREQSPGELLHGEKGHEHGHVSLLTL
jgi:hypothetical protein